MLLVITLSFLKLLWPLLRFSSCTHDQDTRTPTNKLLTLTLRVMHKYAFSIHQNNYSIHLSCPSLSKISCDKKNSMGYAKKREKEKYPCQKAWEKKRSMPKSMKKRKRKDRNKDSSYFQIKGIYSKERDSRSKQYKYILELEIYKNSSHLHILNKVYDLHLLEVWFLT